MNSTIHPNELEREIQAELGNSLPWEAMGKKKVAAILGEAPSKSAKSPSIWNPVFQSLEMDAIYVPMDVSRERLGNLVQLLKRWPRFMGGNVTMPHKIDILSSLDESDPLAAKVGAVNTIVRSESGRLKGYNTDGSGFIRSLTASVAGQAPLIPSLEGKRVLMMGAGGAARAVAFFLADKLGPSGSLAIFNRTEAKSEALVRDLAQSFSGVSAVPSTMFATAAREVDLIVNCTSCGQKGPLSSEGGVVFLEPFSPFHDVNAVAVPARGTDGKMLEESFLLSEATIENIEHISENNVGSLGLCAVIPRNCVFSDIVHTPLETTLLRHARLTGHRGAGGKAMNLFQALDAFFEFVCKEQLMAEGRWTEETRARALDVMSSRW